MSELKPNGLVSGGNVKNNAAGAAGNEFKPNGLVSAVNYPGERIDSTDLTGDGYGDIRDLIAAKKKTQNSSGATRQYNQAATQGIANYLLSRQSTLDKNAVTVFNATKASIEKLENGESLSEEEARKLWDDTGTVIGGSEYADELKENYKKIREYLKGYLIDKINWGSITTAKSLTGKNLKVNNPNIPDFKYWELYGYNPFNTSYENAATIINLASGETQKRREAFEKILRNKDLKKGLTNAGLTKLATDKDALSKIAKSNGDFSKVFESQATKNILSETAAQHFTNVAAAYNDPKAKQIVISYYKKKLEAGSINALEFNSLYSLTEDAKKGYFDSETKRFVEGKEYDELYNRLKDIKGKYVDEAKAHMDNAKEKLDRAKKDDNNSVAKFIEYVTAGRTTDYNYNEQEKEYAEAAANYYSIAEGLDTPQKMKWELEKSGISEEKRIALNYALYGKSGDIGENIILGLESIIPGMFSMLSDTGDATVGLAVNGIGKLFGAKNDIIPEDAAGISKYYQDLNNRISGNSFAYGDENNIVGSVSNALSLTIPSVAVAFATGGIGTGATLGTAGETALYSTVTAISADPVFWTTFVMTYGSEFKAMKERGADDLSATLGAILSASINSYIEGGGVQELAKNINRGTLDNLVKEFALSAAEEGFEEGWQGSVTGIISRFAAGDWKFNKTEEEKRLLELLQEMKGGFIGGAFLGGGQITINQIVNYSSRAEYKKLGEYIKDANADEIKDILAYARSSDNEMIRSLANESKISDTSLGMIYSYMCRDVTVAFDTENGAEGIYENLKGFVGQLGVENPLLQGVVVPQYLMSAKELDISAEQAMINVANAVAESFEQGSGIEAVEETGTVEDTGVSEENAEAERPAEAEAAPATKSESGFEEVSVKPLTVKTTDLAGKETATTNTRAYTAKQRAVRDIGKALGITVTFDNVDNADGYYVKGSNHIVLDYNTVDPIRTVMIHEITHFAQNNEKAWSGFVAAVQKSEAFAKWINGYNYTYYDNAQAAKNDKHTSNKLNIIKEDIKQLYLANGEELSDADIEYEVYAKFCGETLFASEGTRDESLESILARATQKDRNAISRFIHKFVEWIKSKLPNTSYSATLERLENKWLEMVENTEVTVDNDTKNGVSYSYNEYNTNAMMWANAVDRQSGDTKILNRNGKEFVLLEADGEGGYTELIAGKISEVEEYERLYFKEDTSVYGNLETLRSEERGDLWDLQFDEKRVDDTSNSKSTRSEGLQDDASGNTEDLRTGDKRESIKQNTEKQASDEGAFSLPESDTQKSIPSENVRHNQERYLKWLYNSWGLTKYSEEDLKADIKDLRHAVAIYNKGGKYREEARGIIEGLAEKALTNYEPIRLSPDAKRMRSELRSYRFKLTETQKHEAESIYGSVSKFAKATGLKISDNANMWLDSQWQEWAEMYPGYFNTDISEGDMIERLASVIDSLSNMTESYDVDEMLSYNVPQVVRQIVYDIEHSGQFAIDRAIQEHETKKDIEEEKRNTLKNKTAAQNKVRKTIKRFEKLSTKPTKRNYIPSELFATVGGVLKKFEETINTDAEIAKGEYGERLSRLAWRLENEFLSDSMYDALKSEFVDTYHKAAESTQYGRGTELERLSQLIAMEEDETARQKLIDKYNRYYRGTFDFGGDIKKMIDAIAEFQQKEAVGDVKAEEGASIGDFTDNGIKQMFDDLNSRLKDKSPPMYSREDWESIDEVFAKLFHTIENYNKTIGEEKARDIADIGSKMMNETKRNIKQSGFMQWATTRFQDVTSMFNRLGNYETDSEWSKQAKALNDGQKKTMRLKMEFLNRFSALAKDKRTAEMFDTKNLVKSGLYNVETGEEVLVPKEFRLYLAMVALDDDAYRHLSVDEGGITLPENWKKYYEEGLTNKGNFTVTCRIRKLSNWRENTIHNLSDIEKEWLKEIQSYNRYAGDLLNDTFFKLNGFYRTMLENYAHIIVDASFLQTDFLDVSDPAIAVKPGNMNERVYSKIKMYGVGGISQLLRDIETNAQYIGMAIPIRNFQRIYNYRDGDVSLKETLNKKYGTIANDYIEDALSDLIGATRTVGDKGSKSFKKLMNKFKGNYAQAVLSLNLRVAFTQTASFPMAYTILDGKSMAKALAFIQNTDGKKHFGITKADRAWIDSLTPLVWYRTQGFKTDDIEDVVNRIGATGAEKLANKMPHVLKWVNMFDEMTINRLAYASMFYVNDHFKDLEKGSEEYRAKVTEIFESVIEKTQPNYTTMQRSPFMRQGSTNPILAAFSMFKTVPTMQLNRLIDATLELRTKLSQKENFSAAEIKDAKIKFAKTISAVTLSNLNLVIFRALADALFNGFKRYRDKDEEVTFASVSLGILKDFIETPLGMFPVIGDLGSYMIDNAIGGEAQAYDKTLPQLDTINDLLGIGSSMIDNGNKVFKGNYEFDLETELKNAVSDIEKVAGAFGYPVRNAKNLGLGIYYTISDICGKLQGDKEFFESAVEDNSINRVLGRVQTKSQRLNVIITAAEEGKTEDVKRLVEKYEKDYPEDDVFQKIRDKYYRSKETQTETERALSKVGKAYNELSPDQQNTVFKEVKGYTATEKAVEIKGLDKADFDNLYALKRTNKTKFEEEQRKLLNKYSDTEIKKGLEYAQVRYMVSKGISVERYYASKKYANSYDPDKSGGASEKEKRAALKKLGFTEEQIRAFLGK